jgi:hypothetical protein
MGFLPLILSYDFIQVAVARSSVARWWLVGGKVLGQGTTAEWQMDRTRRAEAGLTPVAARRWSGGAALRGGVRRRWSWHGGH